MRLLARVALGVLSVAVLAASALGWVQLRTLDRSTPSAAVIDSPTPPPAAEQNILLVGLDTRTDAQGNPLPEEVLAALNAGDSSSGGGTADSLTVVHVPAGGGRATAISIPRDAYVDLGQGLGRHKINSAWSRASARTTEALTGSDGPTGSTSLFAAGAAAPRSPDDPAVVRAAKAAGARATIGAVERLTGLQIAHFAAVNLAGFADMSDAIGGVPVCLRAPTEDSYTGLSLSAGWHEISGPEALAFVRQRHGLPGGDLDRIARQQVFLAGATDTLLSAGTLTDPFALSRITEAVSRSVTLDAGWDVLAFARQMQGLSAGAVTFRTIPTGTTQLSTPYDGTAVKVDPAAVRSFVRTAIAADAGDPAAIAALTGPPEADASDASISERQDRLVSSASSSDDVSSSDEAPSWEGSDEETDGEDGTTTTAAPPASSSPPITAAAPGCVT
ncbi:LCP family protein [Actinomycetospora cinnamomea]|uniref:LytR family transcriptional attenuator n=1 Tax=Actinomycetospora cinnamomea TaxID=663609 RepID=A0A2U1F6F3_9PSEU|nr:LCP family protein [Actinomycetospora cinnamomea]PVZ07748.1 LytR family transcriptional attenuator [Actinomycetospora cinnamomea]